MSDELDDSEAPAIDDSVVENRAVLDALLAATGLDIVEMAADAADTVPGARVHWRLRCGTVAHVDAYSCDDPQAAVNHLWVVTSPDDDGLPALGQNGSLVYVVHHLGDSTDRTGVYAALDVAGALAGDEDSE